MSRPKPKVLLENIDKKTYKSEQILDAEAIWAVFYQGRPFNLKSANIYGSSRTPIIATNNAQSSSHITEPRMSKK
jgi:hypothetical protein